MLTKENKRDYQRLWIATRRKVFFDTKVCAKCGSPDELELDHINPSLKFSHNIWSWSNERQHAELAKCQVLCKTCHRIKTNEQISKPITHGNSGYNRFCRCEVCVSAHSERMKLRVRNARSP